MEPRRERGGTDRDRRGGDRPRRHPMKRTALLALIAICGVNAWTGAPLLAVWVGSQVASASGRLTFGVIAAIVGTLAVAELLLLRVLTSVSAAYDELVGRPPQRSRAPWLRSMRDTDAGNRWRHVTAAEAILVLAVVAAVVAFEIWFFVYAGSSLPQ